MDLGLRGKTALVTASSQGIGRAIATVLAREGARVALCARDLDATRRVADEIAAATGSRTLALRCDLAQPAEIDALVDAVLAVVDESEAMITRGITAAEIEELDYSPLLRAAQETPPGDTAGIAARRQQVLDVLTGLQ